MNIPLILFLCLILVTVLGTLVVNVIVFSKRKRYDNYLFSKESLNKYELDLEKFLKENNINYSDSITEICSKLGFSVVECDDLPSDVEADIRENKIIRIHKALSIPEKNFGTAHEIAHVIRGSSAGAARTRHKFISRDKEEQICDYFAAAILLPLTEMKDELKRVRYNELTKKEKLYFVSSIAAKKDLREEVVVRRIVEVRRIIGETN